MSIECDITKGVLFRCVLMEYYGALLEDVVGRRD